jgi:hypothetical protein
MAIYTVHEPPRREADTLAHTERFVFVRDGFSWPAFLFGPLWMLRHRLWLVLVLYLLVMAGLVAGLRAVGAAPGAIVAAVEHISLLVGIEASTLRRWTLARRGWTTLGVVVGDDIEAAERRFFDAWVRGLDVSRLSPAPDTSGPHMGVSPNQDVIGLFPEPGARS